MTTLQDITSSDTYKAVLQDSFGGIMYNVANYGKYDSTELLQAWDALTPGEQSSAGGITKGAINFLKNN